MYPLDSWQNIARHHPQVDCPISTFLNCCIFCIRVFLYFCFSDWLVLRFWPLIDYIQIVVCYDSAFWGIWLFLLLRIYIRLFHTFWWSRYWASPHWPNHLGSGQKMTSMTDMSCYHHCNNYSFGGELQWWLVIIKSLPQRTVLGSASCLVNMMTSSLSWNFGGIAQERLLNCTFTFHALWYPKYCIPCDQWVW